jgi:predicted DNA-binding transcriptional regulator AlpA
MNTEVKPYLQRQEVCELVRIGVQTLAKLVREGRFPRPVKLGRRQLWPACVIEQFMLQQLSQQQGAADGE